MRKKALIIPALIAFAMLTFQPRAMATLITHGTEDFEDGLGDWIVGDGVSLATSPGGNTYVQIRDIEGFSQDFYIPPHDEAMWLNFDYAGGYEDPKYTSPFFDSLWVVVEDESGYRWEYYWEYALFSSSSETFYTDPVFNSSSAVIPPSVSGSISVHFWTLDREPDGNDAIFALDNVSIFPSAAVPEPSTMILLGSGLFLMGANRKRRSASAEASRLS